MKQFQYLLGALIFFLVGAFIGWGIPRSSPTPPPPVPITNYQLPIARTASLMFDEGNGTVKVFENQAFGEGETLFAFTKRIADSNGMGFKYDPPNQYGILITEIDGKKNGTSGAYWGYWVNNHLGEVASDAYELKPGDVIEWKFVNLKF